ncbi:MAG: DUF2254 domain-containing protein [Clostridia bacterium]
MSRVKRISRMIKESVWLFPIVYSLVALLLAVLSISYDLGYFKFVFKGTPSFFLMNLDIAKTVLSIIAGAFVTITTFTFSTTMIVLIMYTSQYSPRVVKNFLTERDTLQAFGVFVSGFFYVMIILLFLSNYDPNIKVISATISIVYILVGLIFFFRFVNSVASYIQASNLIRRLKENATEEILEYRDSIIKRDFVEEIDSLMSNDLSNIKSTKDGYIQDYDYSKFINIAQKYQTNLYIKKVIGHFITKENIFCEYCDENFDDEDKKNIIDEVMRGIIVGEQRSEANDFEYSIQKIVELALKALSPGINDPNTAIHCVRITSLLLREIADLPKGFIKITGEDKEDEDSFEVYLEAMEFEVLLANTYLPIINYGKSDLFVMREIINALQIIISTSSDYNKEKIKNFSDYLWKKVIEENFDEYEIKLLRSEIYEIGAS